MPSQSELQSALSAYPAALDLRAEASPKTSADLVELDGWYRGELRDSMETRRAENEEGNAFLTLEEVEKLMQWKLAVRSFLPLTAEKCTLTSSSSLSQRGKWRPRLQQLVSSNPSSSVHSCTSTASLPSLPRASALKELSTLKGLGPATASAVLALWYPSTEPFMSDEAMENVEAYEEGQEGHGKREYTPKAWREFGEKMRARKEKEGWESVEELERALWSWAIHRKYGDTEQVKAEESEGTKPAKATKNSKKRSSDAADVPPPSKKSKSK